MKRARRQATTATAPPPVSTATRWIFDPARDATLVVGAPLWLAPLVFLAAALVGDRGVNTAVMAFGSLGHHLPGMLRAYGDRALFRRFRARFILAPLIIGGACVGFASGGLHAIMLVAFVWGVWHAFMQTYGFARIYAAKRAPAGAAPDAWAARLDLALLAAWFVAAVLLSPLRLGYLVDMAATCGLPFPSAAGLRVVKGVAVAAAATATLAWLGGVVWRWRRARPDAVALALMGSSIAFWCFANVRVTHPLLGAPLFEVFHDVQYLAIVWAFNRRRAQAGKAELRPLLAAMFQPRAGALVFYVAMVAAYGALGLYQPAGAAGELWNGLIAASQLLHFYYDGFIWKVREPATAAPLGVAASKTTAPPRSGRRHLLLWGGLAAALTLLGVTEARGGRALRERIPTLAALIPDNGLYQFYAAEMHWERHEYERALDGFRRSLALDPSYGPSRENLALSLSELVDAAALAHDATRTRALTDELRGLRPGLDGKVAAHVDEVLAAYGR